MFGPETDSEADAAAEEELRRLVQLAGLLGTPPAERDDRVRRAERDVAWELRRERAVGREAKKE